MRKWAKFERLELTPPCQKVCPDRKPGCGATCEAWKEYAEKRKELYDRRRKNAEVNHG